MDITLIILCIVAALVVIIIFSRHRFVAEKGTHRDVAEKLAVLKQDSARDAFLGFCTGNEDALYFICENGMFFLDYELSHPEKKPYEAPFRAAARKFGLSVIDTTYHGSHPVLRVIAGEKEVEAARIGFMFAQEVFAHDENTEIVFLP